MSTSRSLVQAVARRGLVARRSYNVTALRKGGMSPPIAPFTRVPAQAEPMVENLDAVWNDGVAPELALDFDLPNTSSQKALAMWVGALSLFVGLYQGISFVTNGAKDNNPALSHAEDVVYHPPHAQK